MLRARHYPPTLAPLLAAALMVGCGGEESRQRVSLAQLEAGPDDSRFVEVHLGEYMIPVPTVRRDLERPQQVNFMQMRFSLHGVVAEEDEKAALALAERHRGKLRDRVITACRESSLEDLGDPYLQTFRLRLLDQLQPLFNDGLLDRVLFTDVVSEQL